jgi:AcrR family transcriptional regulator
VSVSIALPTRGAAGRAAARKALTQEKILSAAMELFSTRGYHRTSTSQIASRAGVSRASIFWHFSDKATLFGATTKHFLVPFRRSLEQGRALARPRDRILRQIDAYHAFVRERRATIRALLSWISASQPHARALRDELLALNGDFQRGLERDLAETLANPAEAAGFAAMIVAALHGELLLSLGGSPRGAGSRLSFLDQLLRDRLTPEGPGDRSR